MNTPKIELPENVGFSCRNCGVCCHMQPPDVDLIEQKRIEEKGFNDFLEPLDETGICWIRRKDDGSCWFLTKDNKCQIHDIRPAVCKLEPFTIIDYNYEKNIVELAPNYPFSECCPGFTQDGQVNRGELIKAVQILLGKIVTLTADDLELPITDKRVLSEARSRFLRRTVDAADLHL